MCLCSLIEIIATLRGDCSLYTVRLGLFSVHNETVQCSQ